MQEPGELVAAQRDFPLPTECKDVFHCGFASEDSFGATAWLVRRPEGNFMMDSPRYHPGLSKRLQVGWWDVRSMGGVPVHSRKQVASSTVVDYLVPDTGARRRTIHGAVAPR